MVSEGTKPVPPLGEGERGKQGAECNGKDWVAEYKSADLNISLTNPSQGSTTFGLGAR